MHPEHVAIEIVQDQLRLGLHDYSLSSSSTERPLRQLLETNDSSRT